MPESEQSLMKSALRERGVEIRRAWVASQRRQLSRPDIMLDERQLERQCAEFLRLLLEALNDGAPSDDLSDARWGELLAMLADTSRQRVHGGFDWKENAAFLMSLKRPLFDELSSRTNGSNELLSEVWRTSELIDELGLYTAEVYVETRESIIAQQREDLLELSSPVIELWEHILVMPIIGTVDSRRAQEIMTALLEAIERRSAEVVIVDITGVGTVDTLVAQHLIKTVSAARLMGVSCILSGIGPQIAQTIVHLGIDFGALVTRANLSDALKEAFRRVGLGVTAT